MYTRFILFFISCFLFVNCNQNAKTASQNKTPEKNNIVVPQFSSDSAYSFTEKQVSFGPRVPNTEAHVACGNYLASKLKEYGAAVIEQKAQLINYAGTELNATNIIGSFQPENKNRILLFAHWDTRPFADQDPDPKNHKTAIDGANDGAGACAVLLEIARQIELKQPNVGIDIIFFDAEDWGAPSFDEKNNGGYCLGSDYWGKNTHVPNYKAKYGILLDMVSAPGARFYKESFSAQYASHVLDKVWEASQIAGYGHFFVNENGGGIEDDHVHVFKNTRIPCIDIIQLDPNSKHGFGDYWHTLNDNMNHVSKETLQAVGQTLLHVLYHEN